MPPWLSLDAGHRYYLKDSNSYIYVYMTCWFIIYYDSHYLFIIKFLLWSCTSFHNKLVDRHTNTFPSYLKTVCDYCLFWKDICLILIYLTGIENTDYVDYANNQCTFTSCWKKKTLLLTPLTCGRKRRPISSKIEFFSNIIDTAYAYLFIKYFRNDLTRVT